MTLQFSPQQNAAWVHRRLVGFAQRLEQGIARPGECSCIFDTGGYARHSAQWFMCMARQAVRRKYVQAGRLGVVAALERIDKLHDQHLSHPSVCLHSSLRNLRCGLMQGSVRVASHATRWRCADSDLFACTGWANDLTPWIFQQPDMRYRVSDVALTRLHFMLSCWAHYAEHGFTPQAAGFGLNAFPLTVGLRPDISVEATDVLVPPRITLS